MWEDIKMYLKELGGRKELSGHRQISTALLGTPVINISVT
jgi:hypothetical protein